MPSGEDPFELPDCEPLPAPYAAGARAIYAYQAAHRGKDVDALFRKVDGVPLLEHEGITFIPDRWAQRYVPEKRTSAKSGCAVVGGGLLALVAAGFVLAPDALFAGLGRLGAPGCIGIGVAIVALFVFGLFRADKQQKATDEAGIWVRGVFLFPDALVHRAGATSAVYPKRDIVRFTHRRKVPHPEETCLARRGEFGDDDVQCILIHHDATKLLEAWLADR